VFAAVACAARLPEQQPPHVDAKPVALNAGRTDGSPTYGILATDAIGTLLRSYYNGNGLWRDCPQTRCWVHNSDWGSDSLTNTLYLRWKTARDPSVAPVLAALSRTARRYPPPCDGPRCVLWSDAPLWDSVAALREHEVDRENAAALAKAVAAFRAVEGSGVYGLGACPEIRYQRPFGRGDHLKTLETDSNGVKAALLLFDATHDAQYLQVAVARYDAIRRHFMDPEMSLYSVYVFDDGRRCVQVPHRFFASVNGNMIWNGVALYHATGDETYRDEALGTARAVTRRLSDPSGAFMNMQAENDLAEPLIEAMLVLAAQENVDFARSWLLANASAAYSARKPDGTYGRFFGGPPPEAPVTAWQTSGGFASQVAAAALEPHGTPRPAAWQAAVFVPHPITRLPATIRFEGSGFALIGTIGDVCCQPGHARIIVDQVETVDRTGAWQNKSTSGRRFPNSVLFALSWPAGGHHEVTLLPGIYNAKEGGPFLHAAGYFVQGSGATMTAARSR